MKDTIYREDAIGACAYETIERYEARKAIRALPSADRPQGKWKFVGSGIEMIWECPFCGCRTFGFKKDLPNYCSNCGADLRGTDVDDKENDESH